MPEDDAACPRGSVHLRPAGARQGNPHGPASMLGRTREDERALWLLILDVKLAPKRYREQLSIRDDSGPRNDRKIPVFVALRSRQDSPCATFE